MKNRFMKRLAVIILLLCAAVLPVLAAPSTDYTLTGNQADDVITVAKAQVGKTRSDFGWNTLWCGYFAGWAGRTAGADYPPAGTYSANGRMITYWFVHHNKGMFYYFRDANYDSLISHHPGIKNKDHCIKSSLSSFIPQKGDIIMFLWNNADPGDNWSHVGLVESYANGKVYTVEGNVDNKVKTMTRTWNDPQIVGIVRPNYQDNSKPVLTIQFHANGGSVSSDTFAEDSSGYVTKRASERPVQCFLLRPDPLRIFFRGLGQKQRRDRPDLRRRHFLPVAVYLSDLKPGEPDDHPLRDLGSQQLPGGPGRIVYDQSAE